MRIFKLTAANVYINGTTTLGQVNEFKAPDFKAKTSEHSALGMFGTASFTSGIELLEGTLQWSSFYPEALTSGARFRDPVRLMVRGNVEEYVGGVRTDRNITITMTATMKQWPGGSFKPRDNSEFTSEYNATSLKIVYNGITLLDYDALSNTYIVDGVDQLASYKANI
jgi:hypothetical protein